MGMFDAFYGEVQCPHCRDVHKFEEQTKQYDCILAEFLIGDYVEKGNANFTYKFEWFCEKDRDKTFDIGIAFHRGQIVKFLVNEEIETVNPELLDNIKDGLGRRLLYEKKCRKADGIPKEHLEYELNPLSEGYKFIAFEVEWEVIKLYRQKEHWMFNGMEYYYEIKSKEHGTRIMHASKRFWDSGMEIITFNHANKYKSLYFDE